jgi:S1-C subfamily serine protease
MVLGLKKSKLFIMLLVSCQQLICSTLLESKPHGRSWAEISKIRKNAVVQIITCTNAYDFFEPFRSPQQGQACGSGVFISDNGYILTNFHVVENAVGIYAQTGKERFDLEFVGGCPQRDVALLKLTGDSLARFQKNSGQRETPYVEFGDSDKVVDAQMIMLLGHPGGEEEVKITIGHVKGRAVIDDEAYIQTTAPINFGDSGGPFFDEKGNVIGLCRAKKNGSECFGYIIPINNIRLVLEDLMKGGIVRLPFWGFESTPTKPSTRSYLKCPDEGIYLTKIEAKSLAEAAGLEKGDIITALDDHKIDESGYLSVDWTEEKVSTQDYLSRKKTNSTLKVSYCRAGKSQIVQIKVMTGEQKNIRYFHAGFEDLPEYEIFAGMVVAQFSINHLMTLSRMGGWMEPALVQAVQDDESCLIITSIFNTSNVKRSRAIQRLGCILTTVNGQAVRTISDFKRAILAGKQCEFVTFETKGGEFIALPLKDVLKEEEGLSEIYCYKQSDLVGELK